MRLPRKLLRLALLFAVTAVGFASLWACLLLLLPLPSLRRRGRNAVFRGWSRGCLRVMGGRLTVTGSPPAAPFFLVTNHLSYVDVLALAACTDCYFVAKLEIRAWPLFGVLCRSVGTIFVDRESRRDVLRVNGMIGKVLEQGYGVVLFPEGTSTQGYEVAPFRSALFDYPIRSDTAVRAGALTYRGRAGDPPANLALCWWGNAPFLPHAWQLLGLRGFDVEVSFSDAALRAGDRKSLSLLGHREVERLFVPVVAAEERATATGF
ncbi:MAG: lysophospholipid acyltransferase family protein [Thermoanaerobaculia bacterium]|nr:lysophospholipid acyltransferase family protein [Thermoanaerobaculia bacterium]